MGYADCLCVPRRHLPFSGLAGEDRWLSVDEIAADLGISTDTVCTWVTTKGCLDTRSGVSGSSKREGMDVWVREGGPASGSDDFDDKGTRNG